MTKEKLANQLRKKQYRLGLVPKAMIDRLSDDNIIDCYLKNNDTDEWFIPREMAIAMLPNSKNSDDFLDNVEDMARVRNMYLAGVEQLSASSSN